MEWKLTEAEQKQPCEDINQHEQVIGDTVVVVLGDQSIVFLITVFPSHTPYYWP